MTPRNLAALIAITAISAILGHILWPIPPDPRAAPWLAQEIAYRGQLAALERDTARLASSVDSLKSVSRRYYNAASATVESVTLRFDSLGVVPCRDTVIDLRPLAALLRNAQLDYAAAHKADSLALAAARREIVTLTARLTLADGLIAGARPVVVDAQRRHGWRTDALLLGVGLLAGLVLVN